MNANEVIATLASRRLGKAVSRFSVNRKRLAERAASSAVLATALTPYIGYEAAADIARKSLAEGRPVIEIAEEETGISGDKLRSLLDLVAMSAGSQRRPE